MTTETDLATKLTPHNVETSLKLLHGPPKNLFNSTKLPLARNSKQH